MKVQLLLMASILSISGCTLQNVNIQEVTPAQTTIAIGWKGVWEICEACPVKTLKTVLLSPPVRPVAQKAINKPQATEAQPRDIGPVTIYFEYGKSVPANGGLSELEMLRTESLSTDAIIRISGYTDNHGTEKYNSGLAKERANYVASLLLRRGITNPVEVEAYGKCCYAAPNDTDKGRALNRRAVVKFSTRKGGEFDP